MSSAEQTRQVFFFSDLDGTLEDSRADMTAAAQRVRASFGLPQREPSAIMPHVNRGMRELYLSCFDDYLATQTQQGTPLEDALETVRLAYEADYLQHIADTTKLYPGMAETLQALAQRGKVIVVTNKPEHLSRALLDALGVAPLITDVMGGDSCPETKPSALPLRIAAERHGYVPSRDVAFMMGDTAADMTCGKAFGAKTIWCAYGYLSQEPEPSPDFTARTAGEILDLITIQKS